MNRQLFYLLPDVDSAKQFADTLADNGINKNCIHTIARSDIDIHSLPESNYSEKSKTALLMELIIWDVNLIVFFVALLVLLIMLVYFPSFWLLIPAIIMSATLLGGMWYSIKVHFIRSGEFQDALAHGEILLTLTVLEDNILEIERQIQSWHPAATICGSSWYSKLIHD